MRYNLHKTCHALVSLAVLCASGAALPEASTPQVPVVKQKRPLFHDLSRVYPTGNPNDIIEKKQESTRGKFGNWLKSVSILDPQQKVTLRISDSCKGVQRATVSWAFPKGHYFPKNIELDAEKISVIAWQTFPVTAKVKCAGKDEIQTYTTWVIVD